MFLGAVALRSRKRDIRRDLDVVGLVTKTLDEAVSLVLSRACML